MFNLPLAKLYVNSLLSTLNARVNHRPGAQQYTMEGSISDNARRGMSTTRTKRSGAFPPGGNKQPTIIRTQASLHDDVENGLGGYNSQDNFETTGVHIKTIEETLRSDTTAMVCVATRARKTARFPVLEKSSRSDKDSL